MADNWSGRLWKLSTTLVAAVAVLVASKVISAAIYGGNQPTQSAELFKGSMSYVGATFNVYIFAAMGLAAFFALVSGLFARGEK